MTSTSKSSENFFRVWGPGALQLQEPPHGVRQGPLAQAPVVPCADVHGAPALLSGADHCRKGRGRCGNLRASLSTWGTSLCSAETEEASLAGKGEGRAQTRLREGYLSLAASCPPVPSSS